MRTKLFILSTCTKQKTTAPVPGLLARELAHAPDCEKVNEWIAGLRKSLAQDVTKLSASSLYCGDHWLITRSLTGYAERAGFDPELWVMSTGYGLIPADAPVVSYSATFSPTHRDSVGKDGNAFRHWWRGLARWKGPVPGRPRTIAELVSAEPSASVLVVASERYLAAVGDDLEEAAQRLNDRDRLLIVSAGTKRFGPLTANLLPVDARMQSDLGGARRTLNVRMARRVLDERPGRPVSAKRLVAEYGRLLTDRPVLVPTCGRKSTDADVRSFIAAALARMPLASPTALLRHYRDGGRACEQSRFKRIFQTVRARRAVAGRTRTGAISARGAAGVRRRVVQRKGRAAP